LKQEIRAAKFWGYDAMSEEKRYTEKIAEQEHWRNNIKFKLGNWTALVVGAVLCLIAAAVWLDENPSHTAGQLWDLIGKFAGYAVVGGMLLYWGYRLSNRLDRAENEIAWLSQTLRAVKDHAEDLRKGSINNFLELKNRLDGLEEGSVR
jgi:hypothetical protein